MERKTTIKKNTEGYGYKYTELADINKYCEENGIRYYQEIKTCEINQQDYVYTTLVQDGKEKEFRGCKIVDAVLQGIKNPVQQYGSAITYCRRYSLLMALGLATEDDDGASCKEDVKENLDLISELSTLLDETETDRDKFYEYFKVKNSSQMTNKQLREGIAILRKRVGE